MDLFFFDIETVGQYKNFEEFSLNDERGANLFKNKFEKMNWSEKYSDINDAYINNAGIISTWGKIVCISCAYFGDNGEKRVSSIYGDNEEELIIQFNDLLKKIEKKNFNLCGFRIVNFDIPWILHKLHKYEIVPANIIYTYDKKPWEMRITDISEDWKGKFAWSPSLDEVCYELGVKSPKDVISGKNTHEYYWNGKLEEIKDYCEKDVDSLMEISKKIYKK